MLRKIFFCNKRLTPPKVIYNNRGRLKPQLRPILRPGVTPGRLRMKKPEDDYDTVFEKKEEKNEKI
jgi:hypothetical protein